MIMLIFFVTSLFISTLFCSPVEIVEVDAQESIRENEDFVRLLYHQRYTEDNFKVESPRQGNLTLFGFSWDNCGGKTDDVQVKTLAVKPDPIVVPGTVSVDLDAVIAETIQTATSLILVVKKKLFGSYIEVPCVDNFGSCTYQNPCELAKKIECPPQLKALGWSCRCPVPAKEYKVPNLSFKIPKLPLPPSLESGDYQVKATLMNGATRLMCYQVTASLKGD